MLPHENALVEVLRSEAFQKSKDNIDDDGLPLPTGISKDKDCMKLHVSKELIKRYKLNRWEGEHDDEPPVTHGNQLLC